MTKITKRGQFERKRFSRKFRVTFRRRARGFVFYGYRRKAEFSRRVYERMTLSCGRDVTNTSKMTLLRAIIYIISVLSVACVPRPDWFYVGGISHLRLVKSNQCTQPSYSVMVVSREFPFFPSESVPTRGGSPDAGPIHKRVRVCPITVIWFDKLLKLDWCFCSCIRIGWAKP